eukprot:891183-Pleurochrysis_carterae.AAC.1
MSSYKTKQQENPSDLHARKRQSYLADSEHSQVHSRSAGHKEKLTQQLTLHRVERCNKDEVCYLHGTHAAVWLLKVALPRASAHSTHPNAWN